MKARKFLNISQCTGQDNLHNKAVSGPKCQKSPARKHFLELYSAGPTKVREVVDLLTECEHVCGLTNGHCGDQRDSLQLAALASSLSYKIMSSFFKWTTKV